MYNEGSIIFDIAQYKIKNFRFPFLAWLVIM